MADMQGAGGVGRDELDQDFAARSGIVAAVFFARRENFGHHRLKRVGNEEKVDEPRPRDFDFGNELRGRQVFNQGFSHRARRFAQRLGQCHGEITGEVAELAILGGVNLDRRRG